MVSLVFHYVMKPVRQCYKYSTISHRTAMFGHDFMLEGQLGLELVGLVMFFSSKSL